MIIERSGITRGSSLEEFSAKSGRRRRKRPWTNQGAPGTGSPAQKLTVPCHASRHCDRKFGEKQEVFACHAPLINVALQGSFENSICATQTALTLLKLQYLSWSWFTSITYTVGFQFVHFVQCVWSAQCWRVCALVPGGPVTHLWVLGEDLPGHLGPS